MMNITTAIVTAGSLKKIVGENYPLKACINNDIFIKSIESTSE